MKTIRQFTSTILSVLINLLGLKYFILKKILNADERNCLSFINTNSPSYLKDEGWFNSISNKKCIDKNGNVMPWISYSMFDFLDKRLNKNMVLFEYGMGASTSYFSSKIKDVYAIEHDEEWYKSVQVDLKEKSNCHLLYSYVESDDYVNAVSKCDKLFDIVFVDGRKRVKCIEKAESFLTDSGVIILDNSDRERYNSAFTFLYDKGFKSLTIGGLVVAHYMKSETTIFYRENNCLAI